MYHIKSFCTCCLSTRLKKIIDFGNVPLAGSYISNIEDTIVFPLSLSLCLDCFHVQVNEYIDKEYLFKDYRYLSNISMKDHFKSFADVIYSRFGEHLNILEIGSNDGTFIELLSKKNNNVIGVEPSINVSKRSVDKGHNVINDFFSKDILISKGLGPNSIDIVTASNCFAHIDDIDEILNGINYILSENGTFIIEVHYGPNLFASKQYDFIYHEHMYYYSLSSLSALLNRNNLRIYSVEYIETHGGSMRVYVSKEPKENHVFLEALERENKLGFHSVEIYKNFKIAVEQHLADVLDLFTKLKSEGKRIIAYGASGRANAFFNYANINDKIIDFIIDDSPERANRIIPKQNIPIKPFEFARDEKFDILFVTAWNFIDQIREKAKSLNYTHEIVVFPTIAMRLKNEDIAIG